MMTPTTTEVWRVAGSETTNAVWVIDEGGRRVCTVRPCDDDLSRAHLLAAAPTMLEVLEEVAFLYHGSVVGDHATSAIAKAKGVAP